MWAVGLLARGRASPASPLGYLEGGQAQALDLLQRLQGRRLPHDVVLVGIDEAAFAGLGRRQPIARDYLARVVRGVAKSGGAGVGIDITSPAPPPPGAAAAVGAGIRDFADSGLSRVV